jgi:hypothetical protein
MRIWVLGAEDPEMGVIETLLRACGERVEYALARGERVSPREAYQARLSPSADLRDVTEVILVECDLVGNEIAHINSVRRVDHHRPGDPGYGQPPAEFLSASSLGQVILLLGRLDALPDKFGEERWLSDEESLNPVSGAFLWAPERDAVGPGWAHRAPAGWVTRCGAYVWTVPPAIVLAAAADHCLAAAYRGECLGVDPDALMRWRAETRARHQGRSVEDILADVERAREVLRSAPDMHLGGGQAVADLRDREVPELPEAAVRDGAAYLAIVTERDGRRKVVLGGHTTPETVKAFIESWAPAQGLTDLYGDPARGFAGGYLP